MTVPFNHAEYYRNKHEQTDDILTKLIDTYNNETGSRFTLDDVLSEKRDRPLARLKQLAAWMLKKHKDASYPAIARIFANPNKKQGIDHTTVMHSCKRIDQLVQSSPEIKKIIDEVERGLLRAPAKTAGIDLIKLVPHTKAAPSRRGLGSSSVASGKAAEDEHNHSASVLAEQL